MQPIHTPSTSTPALYRQGGDAPETQEERMIRFRNNLIIGGSVVAGSAILYFVGREVIQNIRARRSFDQASTKGTAEYYALRIMRAFHNDGSFGTDEALLRATIIEVPSKQVWEKVETEYRKQTEGGDLMADLHSELYQHEYEEMLIIINQKPDRTADATGTPAYDPKAWAMRLHAGISPSWWLFEWTDEDAIVQVLKEIPNTTAWEEVKQAYALEYGVSLITALEGDVDNGESDQPIHNLLRQKFGVTLQGIPKARPPSYSEVWNRLQQQLQSHTKNSPPCTNNHPNDAATSFLL